MKPTIGRVVHYVLPNGEHRPAFIVRLWSETCVNLQVFLDGSNDATMIPQFTDHVGNPVWKTSVVQDEGEKFRGSWHWPERDE